MVAPHVHHSTNRRHAPAEAAGLRIVTWNIEFAARTLRAIKALQTDGELADADAVLLQEMDERGTAEIADHFGFDYVYVPLSVHPKSGRNFGNAIVSPWPLDEVAVTPLPHRAAVHGQRRAVLGATVHHPMSPVRAFTVHTETPVLTHRKRLRQFVTLGQAVMQWPDLPVVVGGDFNTASPRSIRAVTDELASRSLVRASASVGPTLRRGGRSFELDHIFVARLTATDAGVVTGHGASDHDPVWARFSWEVSAETRDGPSQTS